MYLYLRSTEYIKQEVVEMGRCDGCGGEDCVCCEVFQEAVFNQRYPETYDGEEYYESVGYRQFEDEEDAFDE
jgi:hypothetical protein